MFLVKSCYDNSKSILIKKPNTLDELYLVIKQIKDIPIYLQRIDYNAKELTNERYEKIINNENINLYLSVRFSFLDIKNFVSKILIHNDNVKEIVSVPILINNIYRKPIYCFEPNLNKKKLQIFFNELHYNNKTIYPIIDKNITIIWQNKNNIKPLDYLIDTKNEKKIIITCNIDNIYGKGKILIKNININTDQDINKTLTIKLFISHNICAICHESLNNNYVLFSKNNYYHAKCIKKLT
jgi:hypothetical protein